MGHLITADLRHSAMAELQRVLESAEFRQSEQSKRLLRYLVEHTLDGQHELLRERAIGIALFGRSDGYDTNESPIVRVRANEIRKRLAKYYQEHGADSDMQFEVPSGAYRVEFRSNSAKSTPTIPEVPEPVVQSLPVAESPSRARFSGIGAVALTAVLLSGVAALIWTLRPTDPAVEFWKPALESGTPITLCTGNPVVYRFTRDFESKLSRQEPDHYRSQTEPLLIDPAARLTGGDIVAVRDQYVGLGSAYAVARIYGWLASHKKESEIRFGNDISFTDLRKGPAVLLGAFQNRWSVELSHGLRYVFTTVNGVPGIRDSQTGKLWSLPELKDDGHTTHDYVLISRVLHSGSGQVVILATPITQYGCRAAGDILTNSQILRDSLKNVTGWKRKNLQMLFEVAVIGNTAGPPRLIASHVW